MHYSFDFEHDPQAVFETLTDPDFLVQRSRDLGELSADCELDDDGDTCTVEMTREVQRDLPAFLAKLFNPVQSVSMVETWERDGDGFTGHYTMTVAGQPVTVNADFTLTPTATGSRYAIEFRCKAKIPVVGRKVEKFIQEQATDGVRKELEYTRDAL